MDAVGFGEEGREVGGVYKEHKEGEGQGWEEDARGESAGKFALHFSRETATPSWTLPQVSCSREKGLALCFSNRRFVLLGVHPSCLVLDTPITDYSRKKAINRLAGMGSLNVLLSLL